MRLGLVEPYIPDPLPLPSDQPNDCEIGGNMVVTFLDGTTLTYGPCERPASIDRLWAAMIFEIGHSQCASRCGPDGEPPPQTTKP